MSWFTAGGWATEEESASDLDHRLEGCGMFAVYREVAGTLIQPRFGQRERSMRIDRVLVPTSALRQRGWKHGAVGIEIKRSGVPIGPPLSQALDYVRGAWNVNGIFIQLGAVCIWPVDKQGGPIASLMAHGRIGTASFGVHERLKLSLGEEVMFVDSSYGIRVGQPRAGQKVGSR